MFIKVQLLCWQQACHKPPYYRTLLSAILVLHEINILYILEKLDLPHGLVIAPSSWYVLCTNDFYMKRPIVKAILHCVYQLIHHDVLSENLERISLTRLTG